MTERLQSATYFVIYYDNTKKVNNDAIFHTFTVKIIKQKKIMKRVFFYVSILALVGTINSCKEQKGPKTTTLIVDTLNIVKEASILNDSANSKWNQMMASDSVKFTNIKRLLEEISYCKKYDEKEYERLMQLKKDVYAIRYTQETLSDSLIDQYDLATTDLINKVRNFKVNTPEVLQHPLADQLENDILKAENEEVILYRNHYDKAAIEFNSFLEKNKKAIEKETPGMFKKKKLFSVIS